MGVCIFMAHFRMEVLCMGSRLSRFEGCERLFGSGLGRVLLAVRKLKVYLG